MKKQTILSLFLLFALSLLLVGCGDAEEVKTNEHNTVDMTTTYIVETHQKQVPATREVVITEDASNNVYLQSGVDAIIEFYNSDEESQRLVVYDSNIDILLRPSERVEVKINSEPQIIEYIFGTTYKQIIIQ